MVSAQHLIEVLRDAIRTVAADGDVEADLVDLCGSACRLLQIDGAAVCLVGEDRSRSSVASDERTGRIEALQSTLREGPCQSAIELDSPVVVEDLAIEEQRWTTFAAVALLAGVHTVASIPLREHGVPMGSLDLYRQQASGFSREELEAAEALGEVASAYVVGHRRRARSEQVTGQLQHALDQRVVVEQAKGALAAKLGVSVDDAFHMLRRHARDHNHRVVDVARQVVAGDPSVQARITSLQR
jgi:hypothetical protein